MARGLFYSLGSYRCGSRFDVDVLQEKEMALKESAFGEWI